MKNCIPINWPGLTEDHHKKLISCWEQNANNVKNIRAIDPSTDMLDHLDVEPDSLDKYGFYYLYNWPTKKEFFLDIFSGMNIDKDQIKRLSIQKTPVAGMEPHSDWKRTMSLFYLIQGRADTVFYEAENFVHGKSYHNDNNLTEIERISMNPGSWYLFNNKTIHGVENFTSDRFSMAFDISNLFTDFEHAAQSLEHSKLLFL
jgi:hypothetical protein